MALLGGEPDDGLIPSADSADLAGDKLGALEQKYLHASPEVQRRLSKVIERGQIGTLVKRATGFKCQVCEALGREPIGSLKKSGEPYVEAHHVMPVSKREIGSLSSVERDDRLRQSSPTDALRRNRRDDHANVLRVRYRRNKRDHNPVIYRDFACGPQSGGRRRGVAEETSCRPTPLRCRRTRTVQRRWVGPGSATKNACCPTILGRGSPLAEAV